MKKLFLSIIISFSLIAVPAFGANLVGLWKFKMECLEIGNNNIPGNPGVIDTDTGELAIEWQQQVTVFNGALYKGHICGLPAPNSIGFGTIVGRKVTFTQWDAIVEGRLRGRNTIHLISQHALDNPPIAPGTCLGKLRRISPNPVCP